jgi:hypothetical protein
LLRLGGSLARGQDPSGVSDAADVEPAAIPDPESMAVEPPDDLDLTAREFGPNAGWQADETPTPPTGPVAVADEVTGKCRAPAVAEPAPVVVEAPPRPS